MRTVKFTSWQDGEFFIGFLNEYPDYQTQGMHKEELAENLKDPSSMETSASSVG